MKKVLFILSSILLQGFTVNAQEEIRQAQPIVGEVPQKVADEYLPIVDGVTVEVWVDSLTIPWSLRFLPDGDALVAQRTGSIVRIPAGTKNQVSYFEVPDAVHEVDAGLMGMDLHPDFEMNRWVYIMHAYRNEENELLSRVLRLKHEGE